MINSIELYFFSVQLSVLNKTKNLEINLHFLWDFKEISEKTVIGLIEFRLCRLSLTHFYQCYVFLTLTFTIGTNLYMCGNLGISAKYRIKKYLKIQVVFS